MSSNAVGEIKSAFLLRMHNVTYERGVEGGRSIVSILGTKECVLTDDVQVDEVAHVRRRRYLAFVDAAVAMLRVLDLQRPVLRVRVVDGPEPLVARVRVPADGEQVDVAVPHPRYLKRHLQ